ncbi:MAG: exosome complex RNA-binding protein Rrp4 [Nitrososphaerales archaeon]|jgi:exosome complex component RRP4|nr:exosome complex RNA-binding protein Rrp4 [Nitrososphaerales archaeon]|tara:strand:- start:7704 stop:8393 length:690 start_codon:yes stop_codon:yes gene_type:complete
MPEVKRKYVTPGELVGKGRYNRTSNVYQIEDKFYSTRVGMAEVINDSLRVIPLTGPYIPREDDLVVGKIIDHSAFAWEVDINSCFSSFLLAQSVFGRDYSPARDSLTKKFAIGDLVTAKILAFDRTRDPLLSVSGPGLGRINQGEIVSISPTKVPRVIGKKGAMIKTIENYSKCRLTVGQNGLVMISGNPEGIILAKSALDLINHEAHTADLTQKVQDLLSGSNNGEKE